MPQRSGDRSGGSLTLGKIIKIQFLLENVVFLCLNFMDNGQQPAHFLHHAAGAH